MVSVNAEPVNPVCVSVGKATEATPAGSLAVAPTVNVPLETGL